MTPRRSNTRAYICTGLMVVASLASAFGCHLHGRAASHAFVTPTWPLEEEPPMVARGNTEAYDRIYDNPFLAARDNPVSTFSIDVDTASYANVRRFIDEEQRPPPDAVRVEELVNYFRYAYPAPDGPEPVAAAIEVGPCPWQAEHRLVRIGLRARDLPPQKIPPRSLTFLIDVSGSMDDPRKLPLLKRAFGLLVDGLRESDRVAMVVYAGASGLVLPPTSGADKERIRAALERLGAGGSTNGAEGIELAYATAARAFVPGGVNRVILATDGDFNVGVTSQGDLLRLIESKRDAGIFLSVLGFGMGNYKDSTLEKLADKGDGNYAYIDSFAEARKVLVEDVAGTLITVAKDVKVQVELNPAEVASYRLVGYENRLLRREEFDDDRTDAGDMGAGQTVTALYEVVPAAGRATRAGALRYQEEPALSTAAGSGELMTLKLRWKEPVGKVGNFGQDSRLRSWPVRDGGQVLSSSSADFRFAAGVAAFAMVLRDSPHRGTATMALARTLASGAMTAGADEHRREFLSLCDRAEALGGGSSGNGRTLADRRR